MFGPILVAAFSHGSDLARHQIQDLPIEWSAIGATTHRSAIDVLIDQPAIHQIAGQSSYRWNMVLLGATADAPNDSAAPVLTEIISRFHTLSLPLPDQMNCFVALNRSPSGLEFSEALLGIHSTFDGSMTRLQKERGKSIAEDIFPKLAEHKGEMAFIKDQLPAIFHMKGYPPGKVAKILANGFAKYRKSLHHAQQSLLDRYELRDAAIK